MKSGKGRNRTGSLYRRWQGKKYSIADTSVKGCGIIYLKYTVGGKTIEESLKTADVTEARKKQSETMRPFELASEAEVLEQTELRLKRAINQQAVEWKKATHP
jgi:phage regulator Rha-like protein